MGLINFISRGAFLPQMMRASIHQQMQKEWGHRWDKVTVGVWDSMQKLGKGESISLTSTTLAAACIAYKSLEILAETKELSSKADSIEYSRKLLGSLAKKMLDKKLIALFCAHSTLVIWHLLADDTSRQFPERKRPDLNNIKVTPDGKTLHISSDDIYAHQYSVAQHAAVSIDQMEYPDSSRRVPGSVINPPSSSRGNFSGEMSSSSMYTTSTGNFEANSAVSNSWRREHVPDESKQQILMENSHLDSSNTWSRNSKELYTSSRGNIGRQFDQLPENLEERRFSGENHRDIFSGDRKGFRMGSPISHVYHAQDDQGDDFFRVKHAHQYPGNSVTSSSFIPLREDFNFDQTPIKYSLFSIKDSQDTFYNLFRVLVSPWTGLALKGSTGDMTLKTWDKFTSVMKEKQFDWLSDLYNTGLETDDDHDTLAAEQKKHKLATERHHLSLQDTFFTTLKVVRIAALAMYHIQGYKEARKANAELSRVSLLSRIVLATLLDLGQEWCVNKLTEKALDKLSRYAIKDDTHTGRRSSASKQVRSLRKDWKKEVDNSIAGVAIEGIAAGLVVYLRQLTRLQRENFLNI